MVVAQRARLGLENLGDRVVPATFAWNYQGVGLGDASNSANWVGYTLPGSGDDIHIPAGTGGIDATSLDLIGSWTIEAGWNKTWLTDGLTVYNGGAVRDAVIEMWGNVELGGAMVFGNVLFTSPHPTEVSYLTLAGDPEVISQNKTVEAGRPFESNAPLVNSATLTLQLNSQVKLDGSAPFQNNGRLVFQDSATVWATSANSTFTNGTCGTVKVEKGIAGFSLFVVNRGRMEVLGGATPGHLAFSAQTWLPAPPGPGVLASVRSEGGTWVLRGGGTALSATGAVLSLNDRWDLYRNPTATQNGNVIRIFGDLALMNSVVQFGETGTVAGNLVVDHRDNLTLKNTTVGVTLNWPNDSIDRWEARRITIDGGILAMGIHSEPSPIPAGRSWSVFVAANAAITGTFGSYFLGPNYFHEFDAPRLALNIRSS
ncbi:MAG: hypothetical protein C0501_29500 [Isosphaera sp.]|nr:hypothetical protein [Isosphaera sp.]